MRRRVLWILSTAAFISLVKGISGETAGSFSQDIKTHLMPVPRQLTLISESRLSFGPDVSIAMTGYCASRLERAARRVLDRLSVQTGVPLSMRVIDDPETADLVFRCRGPGSTFPALESPGSYVSSLSGRQGLIEAPGPLGILRAIETFCQPVETTQGGFALPAVMRLVESAYAAARYPHDSGLELLAVDTFREDRPDGWQPNAPHIWEIREEGGERALHLTAAGPSGPVRAPRSWALLQEYDVSDFLFSGRMRCLAALDNPHRDLVVVFHFQDPTHFYYVHFSASSDESHNIIGLVDGRDRVKINLEPAGKSTVRLTDHAYHDFKVTYESSSGMISAYLDDMAVPMLTAADRTFSHGRVGIGSFDDTGSFDTIILWGKVWKGKDHD